MFIKRKFILDYPEKWTFEIKGAADEFLKEFGLHPNYIFISSPHVKFTPAYRENILKMKNAKIQHPVTKELIDIPKGTAMNIESYGGEGYDVDLKFCADETLDVYEFALVYSNMDLHKADPRDKRSAGKEYKRPVFVVQ